MLAIAFCIFNYYVKYDLGWSDNNSYLKADDKGGLNISSTCWPRVEANVGIENFERG